MGKPLPTLQNLHHGCRRTGKEKAPCEHSDVLFSSFLENDTLHGFKPVMYRIISQNHTVSQYKQHHMKELFSRTFQKMVTLQGLIHRLKGWNHTMSQNKQHHINSVTLKRMVILHCLIHGLNVRTTLYHKNNSTT